MFLIGHNKCYNILIIFFMNLAKHLLRNVQVTVDPDLSTFHCSPAHHLHSNNPVNRARTQTIRMSTLSQKTLPFCNHCNIKIENKSDLEEHMKTYHNTSNITKHGMEECRMKMKGKGFLQEGHSGETQCVVCDQTRKV